VGHVDAEAVHPPVEPEPQDLVEVVGDLRVPPVEVGLLGGEQVEIPLPAVLVEGPRRTTEDGGPVVRRASGAAASGPHVAATVRVEGVSAGVDEPGMPARSVVGDQVHEYAQPSGVGVGHQLVELGESSEARVDVAVLGHVIAVVEVGRRIERGDPEGVDPEALEVGKARPEAGQVTQSVAVAVGEAAQVDLVEDRSTPPGTSARHGPSVKRETSRSRPRRRTPSDS
jgi:hypothetical protein